MGKEEREGMEIEEEGSDLEGQGGGEGGEGKGELKDGDSEDEIRAERGKGMEEKEETPSGE